MLVAVALAAAAAAVAVAVAETDSGSIISYESTCAFLRPLVMGNKNEFIDCFHG